MESKFPNEDINLEKPKENKTNSQTEQIRWKNKTLKLKGTLMPTDFCKKNK